MKKNAYKITKKDWPAWIEYLAGKQRLYAPTQNHGGVSFNQVHNGDEVVMAGVVSLMPPKKYLLPYGEPLLTFNVAAQQAAPSFDDQPQTLLGVRTCDAYAIALLDQFFLRSYQDQHYQTRRENTTIITVECLTPCDEYCFCKDMGTLSVPDEFDLHLVETGQEYILLVGSDKGDDLIKDFKHLQDITPKDHSRLDNTMSEKWPKFSYQLKPDITELPHLFNTTYKSALWEEIGEKCLACGVCNLVCPTCTCFNVVDEVDFSLKNGQRVRMADSCQLDTFALVAGGHNFRPTRGDRQRHRFLHKYSYQTSANQMAGCVGCGRCTRGCLVNINPVEVINQFYQADRSAQTEKKGAHS